MSNYDKLGFVYKKEILDRSIKPGFDNLISNADKLITGLNPFCGDEVKYHIKLKENILTNIYLEVEGCAIHKASSSFLCDVIINEKVLEVQSMCEEFISYFKKNNDENKEFKNEKLKIAIPLLDIKTNQIRIKCVLLSWNTMYNNLFSRNQ
tara:strand:- start:1394 stop:1846 length:453 start_codon:yes stop_codon:yes gene_type:complete